MPDNRAYELVSPQGKGGTDILAESTRTHAAAGETAASSAAVTFAALGGFADVQGTGIATEYLAQRDGAPGTSGWTTHGITPRQEPLSFPGVTLSLEALFDGLMAPDLSKAVFRSWSPLTDAPNVRQVANLYVREDLRTAGTGLYRLITDAPSLLPAPNPPLVRIVRPAVADATQDFEHILFESDAPLTGDARGGYPKLYKTDGSVTRLIAVGAGCPGGSTNNFVPGQCAAAGLGARAGRYTPRVLSNDGRRVSLTAPVTTFGALGNVDVRAGVASKLFQLDDRGTPPTADDAMAQVSASEKAAPDTTRPARYQIASIDGARVFFISDEQLTDSAGGGLYMWERQPVDETQSVTVDATGGTFTLTFHSQLSAGTGVLASGSSTVTSPTGSYAVGQSVSGNGIPPGTTIVAMGTFNNATNSRLTLSANAIASGTQRLSASLDASTGALPFDATASQVQSALESLPAIGAGNVTVTGGPGGTAPYSVTFTGALAGVNVAQLSADGSALTGGAAAATILTPRPLKNLTLLTALPGSNTDGAIGASEDGHRLYFGAAGNLVGGAPPSDRGLYYWQDADGTVGGTLSYIGGVSSVDLQTIVNFTAFGTIPRAARVTPDGRYLAFLVSDGSGLTPRYDQSACNGDNANGNGLGGCSEVYLYRADSSSPTAPDILCASCNASGAPATVSAWISIRRGASATPGTTHLNRGLSDDGRRVFFSTAEALVPEDTNNKFDAYAYDVPAATHHLISSGKDGSDSYFLDASADGHDVYFVTRERLVGWDTDGAYDLYDARVGGGFPEPPAPPRECAGDACQGQASSGPGMTGLGSAVFRGLGNARPSSRPRPLRCRRGKVKRRANGRTRCVRRSRGQRAKRRAAAKRRAK